MTPDFVPTSGYTASPHQPYSPTYSSNPPPPPPKPSSSSQKPSHTSPQPRNPPPIPSSRPDQQIAQPPIPPALPPPEPHEHWLPKVVLDKTSAQLTSVLRPSSSSSSSSPDLLTSLSQSHPSLSPQHSPLPPLLAQTAHLAAHTSSRHAHLLSLRDATQRHLLQVRALERQWRDKQAMLDRELEPWSAKSLYEGLRGREREEEEVGRVGEGSWLDGSGRGGGDGVMGEREVEEWVRGWRDGRVRGWRRREERERWDEGRVGGWR